MRIQTSAATTSANTNANTKVVPANVEVSTPAKLNLFLEVLGRRPDGYHEMKTLMVPVSTTTARKGGGQDWRWRQLSLSHRMFLVALVCQFATVLITWPVWNLRESPINLPLVPGPAVSFGPLVLLSLVVAFFRPRLGVALHVAVVGVACVFDQYRLQPQFLSLIVLMWACVADEGARFGRWYLAAMWLWAGLHKLLSVEWWGCLSWSFLEACGISPAPWHLFFAAAVALGEIGLGLLAIFAPRRAAGPCLVMHLGILLALSPLFHNHNPSVWPWSLATAIVGAWLLRQPAQRQRAPTPVWRYRYAVTAALFLVPAGYYFDLVNPRLAFVLYSGNLPYALHTSKDSLTRLDGWGSLAVPFPDSPRLFVQVFQRTAAAGDKLHVGDPRWGFADRYYLKASDGSVREISREEFSRADAEAGEVVGIELESRNAMWRIARSGGVLQRDANQVVYSAMLAGPACSDEALGQLSELRNVRWLHLENVGITSDGLKVLDRLPQLEVLHLPSTRIDDGGLARIGSLSKLHWLDLRDTRVTSAGLAHLQTLWRCAWIDLSGTDIDDEGLRSLSGLTNLEVLQLERTKIGDPALVHVRGLVRCEHLNLNQTFVTDGGLEHIRALASLRTLKLRGTRVTDEGVRRIQTALPGCEIEW